MKEEEEEKTVAIKAANKAGRYDMSAWETKNSLMYLKTCSYIVGKDARHKKTIYLECSSCKTFTLTKDVTKYTD